MPICLKRFRKSMAEASLWLHEWWCSKHVMLNVDESVFMGYGYMTRGIHVPNNLASLGTWDFVWTTKSHVQVSSPRQSSRGFLEYFNHHGRMYHLSLRNYSHGWKKRTYFCCSCSRHGHKTCDWCLLTFQQILMYVDGHFHSWRRSQQYCKDFVEIWMDRIYRIKS